MKWLNQMHRRKTETKLYHKSNKDRMYMKIYEEVKDAATIGISGHIRPDGDCIGSVMGLYLYLLKKCPDAQIEVFL